MVRLTTYERERDALYLAEELEAAKKWVDLLAGITTRPDAGTRHFWWWADRLWDIQEELERR